MSSRGVPLLLLIAATAAGCIKVERDEDTSGRAPVARIAVTPSSGPAPLTVNVSGQASTAEGGTITGHAWTFGDGGSATGATAVHVYAAAGAYRITLTVTDAKGRTGTATADAVATGPAAVYDASAFDGVNYQDEATSGTYDATTLQ